MTKVFVTGGSGFVGQNVIPILKKNGYEVQALVRSDKAAQKVQAIGAIPIMDDLLSLAKNTKNALAECDYVLHAAAHMDFTYDRKLFYAMNVTATEQLLTLAKAGSIQKFVYISAAPVVPGSPIFKLTEDQARAGLPTALYPKTKAIAEKAVLTANSVNFQTIALRPPAIWGPNNHHYEELFAMARQGKWRWIGGGNHVLSTIHVFNLANAVLAAFESNKGGEAYFVTDGDYRSMKQTFKALMQAAGIQPGDKVLSRRVAVFAAHLIGGIWKILGLKSRPPVAPIMIRLMGTEFSVSDEKARHELGYKNAISFQEGIAQLD